MRSVCSDAIKQGDDAAEHSCLPSSSPGVPIPAFTFWGGGNSVNESTVCSCSKPGVKTTDDHKRSRIAVQAWLLVSMKEIW